MKGFILPFPKKGDLRLSKELELEQFHFKNGEREGS